MDCIGSLRQLSQGLMIGRRSVTYTFRAAHSIGSATATSQRDIQIHELDRKSQTKTQPTRFLSLAARRLVHHCSMIN
jgi:hypothetical protein